ncbi:MAG: 50S ribosome-binding GTPase [Candidatus Shikimatogenerans bostrichidophilus]|nr:MAG: 50S ribosome-binding GTPase [Candidatus Shikimatogenerans bostrichidophilus]
MKKIISIIGKTNVGKSTLFNYLIKKKQSFISNNNNTTINVNNGILKIKNCRYYIKDTSGYNGDNINYYMYESIYYQILLSIKKSNLILFLVDIITGVNYLDYEIYKIILKYNKPFFFIINKIDIKSKKNNIYSILNSIINYKKIYLISITHNIGLRVLLKDINKFFNYKSVNIKKENIKISIVGVPNSGKSTFINSFFLNKYKSIVNNKSGTTVDTLYFLKYYKNYIYTLIDTPGILKKYKYKKYKYNNKYLLKTNIIIKESDICILIIDIINGINKNDIYIINLIIKYKKGIIIIFNKCDLLKKNDLFIFKKKILKTFFLKYIPIYFLSLKYNYKENNKILNKIILKIYKNRNKKFNTSLLNNKLLKIINNKNFKINNKLFKIKFCYQYKKKEFPYFIFISNLVKDINISYKKYIENVIRKYINKFYGIPIELKFKKK